MRNVSKVVWREKRETKTRRQCKHTKVTDSNQRIMEKRKTHLEKQCDGLVKKAKEAMKTHFRHHYRHVPF